MNGKTCCKASRFDNWCEKEGHKPVYTDAGGNSYCVFHAPKGKKGVDVGAEEFKEMVFAKIDTTGENNQCNLSKTIFEWEISFSKYHKTNPLPEINFSGAEFSEKANFFGVKFSKGADLTKAEFNGGVDFIEAEFSGGAYFSKAKFNGEAGFSVAKFTGKAYFTKAEFNGEAYFSKAEFNGGVDFFGAKFNGGAYFTYTIFSREHETSFIRLHPTGNIRFEGVSLDKFSFADADLRSMDFINCEWPKRYGRDVLYDEIRLPSLEKEIFASFASEVDKLKNDIKKVETLYRLLKQKCKEAHNEAEAGKWHYNEKEMYRKGSRFRRFFPLSASSLYWLACGYGERPARAGVVLAAVFFGMAFLLGLCGLELKDERYANFNYGILKGIIAALQAVTFHKTPAFEPLTFWGDIIETLAKILIPLQTAFLALALRNRFRR